MAANSQDHCCEMPSVAATGWFERRSRAFHIGLVLGVIHLLFMLWNIGYMIEHHDGRWHMFWIICGYIDFPVSVALSRVILPAMSPFLTSDDPYLSSSTAVRGTFMAYHAVVGSAWYAVLPVLVQKASRAIGGTRAAARVVGAMLVTPILVHWLQLVRFVGSHAGPTAIGLNSILPAAWMAMLLWLFITSTGRRRLLWLFVLAPLVFYNLIGDIHYYSILSGR